MEVAIAGVRATLYSSTGIRLTARISSGVYMAPVGLEGDTNSIAFVLGFRAASSCSTVALNPLVSSVGISTGVPPASLIASGYVTQYGAGRRTSSPGSTSVARALNTACFPPLVMSTWVGVISYPESRPVLAATASRSSGNPAAGLSKALTPKPAPVVDLFHVNPITTTVADAVAELLDELPRAGRITFRRLTADLADRIEVIIRFLAVLELYKQGAVEIDQPERLGDIEVAWTAGDAFDADAILIDAYDG